MVKLTSIIPSTLSLTDKMIRTTFLSFPQLERMKYPSKYVEKVRRHGLNGPALVFGDVNDLKDLLDMTFGEWAKFRLHFLGTQLRRQVQNKKAVTKSSQPHFPLHIANQYASNPCLATHNTREGTSFQ